MKKIDPRGISRAGQNGAPPRVGTSAKDGHPGVTAVKLPGGTPKRNTKNPGPAKGGGKAPKKGHRGRISTGSLNIKPQSAKGRSLKTATPGGSKKGPRGK